MSGLSYKSQAERDADKAELDRARAGLDVTEHALSLDDCGLWQLAGKRGRVTTWGDGEGYLLHLYERSRQAWSWAKKRLACAECVLMQDADGEGVFRLKLPLPTDLASEIRELAGLRKALSEEALAALAERAHRVFGH